MKGERGIGGKPGPRRAKGAKGGVWQRGVIRPAGVVGPPGGRVAGGQRVRLDHQKNQYQSQKFYQSFLKSSTKRKAQI